jgi:hypothetical protein
MKKLLYLSIIAIGIVLTACPYDGDAELCTYEEAIKTDKKIMDIWVAFNEDGGRDEVKIEKGNKAVLLVSHKHFEPGNKLNGLEKYRAYATTINDEVIYTLEKEDGKYNYCKYAWTSKNEFYVQYVDKEYMEANFKQDSVDTKVMRTFLGDHLKNSKLFTEKMEFYRKYSPEYEKVKIFMRKSGF